MEFDISLSALFAKSQHTMNNTKSTKVLAFYHPFCYNTLDEICARFARSIYILEISLEVMNFH